MTEEKKLTLNEAIINIRVELQNMKLKKSGQNKFAGFKYFELSDFLPALNMLMLKYGINDILSITSELVTLELVKGDERNKYTIPFSLFDTPLNKKGEKSMQDIQYFGALDTYYKRYIYQNAFGITDGEVVDAMDNNALDQSGQQKASKPKKINKQIAQGYHDELMAIKEAKGAEDGAIMRWFLEKVGRAKIEDITMDQLELADALIKKLKGE